MIVAIFGDRRSTLPPDWTNETVVAVFGDPDLDSLSGSGSGASLTFVGIGGDLTLRVPRGSRIREGGVSIFGDRHVEVASDDGPEIRVNSYGLFGDVKVTDRPD